MAISKHFLIFWYMEVWPLQHEFGNNDEDDHHDGVKSSSKGKYLQCIIVIIASKLMCIYTLFSVLHVIIACRS